MGGGLPADPVRIETGVGKRLAGFAGIVLAVGIRVVPVEFSIARTDIVGAVAGIEIRLLVGEGVDIKGAAGIGDGKREIEIEVQLGVVGLAHEGDLRVVVAFVRAEIGVRVFVGDVDQIGEAEVLHLPGVVPIARVVPLAIKTVFGHA